MKQTVPLSRYRSPLIYPAVLLGISVLIATSLLTIGYLGTKTAISQRQAEDLSASLAQVIPAQLHDNDLLENPLQLSDGALKLRVYRGFQRGNVTAIAFSRVTNEGYAGPIEILMGIAADGQLLGARVLSHRETPGLGDKMEISKSDWILTFSGRSLSNTPITQWAVKKDGGRFDQFTGATITPRALVKTIRNGLLFFEKYRPILVKANTLSIQASEVGATQ